MTLRRIALPLALALLGACGLIATTAAAATPIWNVDLHHNPTDFEPGHTGDYWLDLNNVGATATSGQIEVTVNLPAGLSFKEARENFDSVAHREGLEGTTIWSCSGTTTVLCTASSLSIPRHSLYRGLVIVAEVEPAASGPVLATATVEGGGAAIPANAAEPTTISSEPAGFGIVAPSFRVGFLKADGTTPVLESGAHPELATFPFDFNSIPAPTSDAQRHTLPNQPVRDVHVDLPPGFLGNPTAVSECTPAQFTVEHCPPSSQVGRIDLHTDTLSTTPKEDNLFKSWTTGVFNLSHPRGVITDLAFVINQNPVHVKVSLNPQDNYAITSEVSDINESVPALDSQLTIWGVPADHSHDSERTGIFNDAVFGNGNTSEELSTDHAPTPFVTVPSQCGVPHTARLYKYDSWQHTGLFGPEIDYTQPDQTTNCDKPRFEPDVFLEPTGHQANTPTGLDVHIKVPQNENPNALATPPIKSTVVTLPEGMTVSPSFADGLAGCSEAQIGLETNDPVNCPDNSRIGEVELHTPLLPKPIEGSMYLAKQEENPFHSLLAVYLAVHDTEERGILVKVPGEISLNPTTGQITTSFEDLPQFPFEDLTLKFRSGSRAPLINPPTCGAHTIAATMTSYARPNEAVDISNSYQVTEGPGGSPCINDAAKRPFNPQLVGGTLNPLAGAFSPMSLRVFRSDADQELSTVEGTAPPGLVASLRGVGRCSEAQIAAAMARSKPGQGALEVASPSCPANSQVGTLEAGAGAGPSPIYVPGKIYLAGPYKGAPLSGVAIVPAIAGPVDLGNVVVRAPAYVDPRTAQIRIASDPLPQIVDGVLIRTRDVRIHLDRPNFSLNPTSCDPMAIEATLHSTEGAIKNDSQRFQAANCASLGFKPRLGLKLIGGTRRGAFPKLRLTYAPRPGDANLSDLVLRFPHSEFIEQGHFRTICTRVQFAAGAGFGQQCPAGSVYGHVRVFTPLLAEPLEGVIYLRSSNHNLPDVVLALQGPPSLPIEVEVPTRIDSTHGELRASAEATPDVPISEVVLEMQGAQKGLFVNSTDLCRNVHRADVEMSGQNGKAYGAKPALQVKCPKASKRQKRHKRAAHGRSPAG